MLDVNPSLNSGQDWPFGYGVCCCGCGKKARVADGVLLKFHRKYHERWLLARMQREKKRASETPKNKRPKKQVIVTKLSVANVSAAYEKQIDPVQNRQTAEPYIYPITDTQKPLPKNSEKIRPNKYAIAKHLPEAFKVSQSEINKIYAEEDIGRPTANEREKQFPHLNAPTVELRNRFKKVVVTETELADQSFKQQELFDSKEKNDRLSQQLAWVKANQPLLEAISRARSRVDATVNGARIRMREKTDIEFRVLQRIRVRVSAVLKGRAKGSSTLRLIGCTLPELKAHLERQFKTGMTWANYGEWHVDHIRPCASFDFSEPASLSRCFHYTNLQPMWGEDNFKKSSNWEGKLIRRKNQE